MSNFSKGEDEEITYTEPRGVAFYRAEVVLSSEYMGDHVGLCLSMYGNGESVTAGIADEADVQQFLYSAAVQSKLIKDGDPLILMKKVTAEVEDAA